MTHIKIRGYHCDFYGHVNNARYLEFYEEDRWAWLDEHIDLTEWVLKGLTFAVVNININYRRAIKVGMVVRVQTRVEQITARSMALRQEMLLEDSQELVSDALVTFVVIGNDGRAVEMDGERLAEIRRLAGV